MSEFNTDQLEIIKGKDAYPYEWVDSYKNLIIHLYHLNNVFIHH